MKCWPDAWPLRAQGPLALSTAFPNPWLVHPLRGPQSSIQAWRASRQALGFGGREPSLLLHPWRGAGHQRRLKRFLLSDILWDIRSHGATKPVTVQLALLLQRLRCWDGRAADVPDLGLTLTSPSRSVWPASARCPRHQRWCPQTGSTACPSQ